MMTTTLFFLIKGKGDWAEQQRQSLTTTLKIYRTEMIGTFEQY